MKMDKDERMLREKEFIYEFWYHTKKRYNAYLKHMETLQDQEEWQIVAGCAIEFFAILSASYARKYSKDKTKFLVMCDELWDCLEKTEEAAKTKSPQEMLQEIMDNVVPLHKGTIN